MACRHGDAGWLAHSSDLILYNKIVRFFVHSHIRLFKSAKINPSAKCVRLMCGLVTLLTSTSL